MARLVSIERRGKKAVTYELIQYIRRNTYYAIKVNGGERPRRVYFLVLKEGDKYEEA